LEEFGEGFFEGVVVFPVLEVAGDVVFADFAGEVGAGGGVGTYSSTVGDRP
jgi:hypothetical protein